MKKHNNNNNKKISRDIYIIKKTQKNQSKKSNAVYRIDL